MGYYNRFPGFGSGMTVEKVFGGVSPANIGAIYSPQGLAVNSSNRYGVVDGSGGITRLDSVYPGPLGKNFPSDGTAPTLSGGAANFPDAVFGNFLQSSVTTDFDFMYINATPANLKWTVFIVASFADIAGVSSFFGNNGVYFPNGGVALWCDMDGSKRDMVVDIFNTAGGGVSVCNWRGVNMISPDQYAVYAIQLDFSLAQNAGRVRGFNGTTEFVATTTGSGVPMTSTNSIPFALGDALTYGGGDMTGAIKFFAVLNTTVSDSVRNRIMSNISIYTGVPMI